MDLLVYVPTLALLGLRIRYWIIIVVVILVIIAIAWYLRRRSGSPV